MVFKIFLGEPNHKCKRIYPQQKKTKNESTSFYLKKIACFEGLVFNISTKCLFCVVFLFNVPVKKIQSFWDGATNFWVLTITLGTLKCLAQGYYMVVVGFEPWTSRSRVRSSTTEPPQPPKCLYRSILNLDGLKVRRVHGVACER